MDEMRAMLDELMGKERNMDLRERDKFQPKEKHFTDRNICKYYLCDFCPYEEFRRTKNDCGDCPGVHDEECRRQWEALSDREKDRYGYERELMRWLERLLGDLRRRVESNSQRLAITQRPAYLADDKNALDAMTKQIDELLTRAATLGEEGDIDAAQAATTEAEALREERKQLERAADARAGNAATRNLVQSVCKVSGLIINDEESRLRDHHAGRNYNSWMKLHETHARLKELFKKREEERRAGGRRDRDSRDQHRGSDRGYSRGREYDRRRRSRSRSRDRYRRRRSRSRSRDRGHRDRGHRDGGSSRDYRDYRDRRERERDTERDAEHREEQQPAAAAAEEGELQPGLVSPPAVADV